MAPRLVITLQSTFTTLLFVLGGLAVAAGIYGWSWFFEGGLFGWFARRIGRRRVQVAALVLGVLLVALALVRATGTAHAPGG